MTDVAIEVVQQVFEIDLVGDQGQQIAKDIAAGLAQTVADVDADRVAAQAAQAATAVMYATFADYKDDAGALALSVAKATALGLTDVEPLNAFLNAGIYIAPPLGVNRIGRTLHADLNAFTALTAARAGVAYALDANGAYVTAAANALRNTSKGILLETAATQLASQPTNIGHANWTLVAASKAQVAGAGPSGLADAYDLVETTTGYTGVAATTLALGTLAAGSYTPHVHMKRGDRPYTMFNITIGGQATAYIVDWDAVGGPVLVQATGGIPAAVVQPLQKLADGWVRVGLSITLVASAVVNMTVLGCSATTFASRVYTTTAGTKIVRMAMAGAEAGLKMSSPILVGGATRPADAATLALAAGDASDTITIDYEGGTTSFLRSSLAVANVLNLVTDGGAPWLSKSITAITLVPKMPAAFRTGLQKVNDRASSLIEGAIGPIRTRLNQLLASGAHGPIRLALSSSLSAGPQTDSGATPYLVCANGEYFWNGDLYQNEALLVAAAGGTGAGIGMTLAAAWQSTMNLLPGVDFAATKGGFDNVSATATTSLVGGELQMSATGGTATFSRSMIGPPGTAYLFSMDVRRGTTASAVHAFLSQHDANYGTGATSAAVASTVTTRASCYGGNVSGQFWVGGIQFGSSVGTSIFDNPTLYEVRPAKAFPQANFMIELTGTLPASLPATTQVIWQGDCNAESDRMRIELRADGSIHLVQTTVSTQILDIAIGTLAGGAAFRLIVAASRALYITSLNGVGVETDNNGAPGISHFRVGRSFTGETFTGTVTGYTVWDGIEGIGWINRRTAVTFVDTSRIWVDGDSYSIPGGTGIGFALADLGYDLVDTGLGGTELVQQIARLTDAGNKTLYGDRTQVLWDGSPNGHTGGQYATDLALVDSWVAGIPHNRWLYVRSGQIPVVGAAFAGASITGTTLTVPTAPGTGNIQVGATVTAPGVAIAAGTTIVSQLSGTTGKQGAYQVSVAQTVPAQAYIYAGFATTAKAQETVDMEGLFAAISGKYGEAHVFDPLAVARKLAINNPAVAGYALDQSDLAFGYFPRSILYDSIHLKPSVRRAIAKGIPSATGAVSGMFAAIERVRRL